MSKQTTTPSLATASKKRVTTAAAPAKGARRRTPSVERRRAAELAKALQAQAAQYRKQAQHAAADDPEARDYNAAAVRAIDDHDEELLAYYGIDVRWAWLEDIVSSLIRGDREVRVQLSVPAVEGSGIGAENTALATLFEHLMPYAPTLKPVRPAAVPDADVEQLIARLQTSKRGTVTTDETGNAYFKPTRQLLTTAALHRGHHQALLRYGILVRRADGTPSTQVLDAANFLRSTTKTVMHVAIVSEQFAPEQDCTYVLLRALDEIRQESYHNIFYDPGRLSPELVAYAAAILLLQYVERFLGLLDYYDEWQAFDPYEYAMRNYGESLLPEDDQIIHGIIDAFSYIGLRPQSITHAADVGTGSNFYPLMFFAPYLKNDATLEALEFSEPNRAYLRETIAGTVRESHRHIWEKFERLMVQLGGERYRGAEALAKQKTKVRFGDIFDLPKGRYELLSAYFVTESIVDSPAPFRKATQSLTDALAPGGILMAAHMVGSEGYFAGHGTHFPALNATIEDIAQAYRDADMEFVVVPVGEDTAIKAREGYHGMAFVVATKRPASKTFQAALDRLAALPGSVRSTSTYDYSIEYCHIYTNESIGQEHADSLTRLSAITRRLDRELATYNLCVMVDDYTFPGENFDYAKLLEWMEHHGAHPHFLLREADLIPSADEVVELMTDDKQKRDLERYIKRKGYPCSLFIAAWYLSRLGALRIAPPSLSSYAEQLINILPQRFDTFEREAQKIIAATPFKDYNERISNEYLSGETQPRV